MAFIKDGETKIYRDKFVKSGEDNHKNKVEKQRYTIDDLVRDTDGPESEVDHGEDDASY